MRKGAATVRVQKELEKLKETLRIVENERSQILAKASELKKENAELKAKLDTEAWRRNQLTEHSDTWVEKAKTEKARADSYLAILRRTLFDIGQLGDAALIINIVRP